MGPAATGGTGPAAVVETHISVLVLVGDRAYKLKKPARFDVLDFSTREQRRVACEREVQLNRRLSPDVYLGVLDVVDAEGGLRDHLVEMVRMPHERRLATLVRGDDPHLVDHLDALARTLAQFHAAAGRGAGIDTDCTTAAVSARWEADLTELTVLVEAADVSGVDGRPGVAVVADVAALVRRWLAGRGPLFDERIAGGHCVDGHGDLQAADVYCLDDGPRVLDCIEFSDALRHVDVWNDVAFLVMDLARLGRPDLGQLLADRYRRYSGDAVPASLVRAFVAHWAVVRAKVALLRAAQEPPGDERSGTEAAARELLGLALHELREGEVRLVLVGGLPGTGKSTVAEALAGEVDAVLLGSDTTRKERAGLGAVEPAPSSFREGLYDEAGTAGTYGALLERAAVAVTRGWSVVLDASWTDAGHRAAARVAAEAVGARLVELECRCPADVAEARIAARRAAGPTASDADAAVARAMAAAADPWPDAIALDTTAPPADVLARALSAWSTPAPPPTAPPT